MDINCKKGDRIFLTDHSSQTFLGIVKSVNVKLGRVVLRNAFQFPGRKTISGYRNFDKHEIVRIKKCELEDSEIPDDYKIPDDIEVPDDLEVPVDSEVSADLEVPPDLEVSAGLEIPADLEVPPDVEVPADLKVSADLEVPPDVEVPADLKVSADLELPADLEVPADLELPADLKVPADLEVPPDVKIPADLKVSAYLEPADDLEVPNDSDVPDDPEVTEDSEVPDDPEDVVQRVKEKEAAERITSSVESKKKIQNEYQYINDFGENFRSAISLLKTCKKIGIYGKDATKGRMVRMSVMAISTPSNVFILDLNKLGDDVLEKGLKEILESPKIVKVTYDCRTLSDCLKYKHLINLENVRDVEAEDIMVVFQDRRIIRRHSRPLEYLSKVYLGLDLEEWTEEREIWRERPLPENLLQVLVSYVSVLLPLHEAIEQKYLQKLIGASNIYNNHLRDLDYFDFLYANSKMTLRNQIGQLLMPQSQNRICNQEELIRRFKPS